MGPRLRGDDVNAGISAPYRLHYSCEAVSRVRSHISPGPYRSFRELSLARSVDLATWCPPTFVGNSGIECSNGHRGFALFHQTARSSPLPALRGERSSRIDRCETGEGRGTPHNAIIDSRVDRLHRTNRLASQRRPEGVGMLSGTQPCPSPGACAALRLRPLPAKERGEVENSGFRDL